MLDYTRINFTVNGYKLAIDSLDISQSLSSQSNYMLGNKYPFDISSNNLSTNISISYFLMGINGIEQNKTICDNWKSDPTGSLLANLNIGGVAMTGYLTDYSFKISPNNTIKANANYIIFNEINSSLQNQSWGSLHTGGYPHYNQTGIGHYWSTVFYKATTENLTGDIIQLDYDFKANISPKYKIGSPFPSQVIVLDASETIDITNETQYNTSFSGKKIEDCFAMIDSFSIRNLSSTWGGSVDSLSFGLTGFNLISTKNNINTQNSIIFSNIFKKDY